MQCLPTMSVALVSVVLLLVAQLLVAQLLVAHPGLGCRLDKDCSIKNLYANGPRPYRDMDCDLKLSASRICDCSRQPPSNASRWVALIRH